MSGPRDIDAGSQVSRRLAQVVFRTQLLHIAVALATGVLVSAVLLLGSSLISVPPRFAWLFLSAGCAVAVLVFRRRSYSRTPAAAALALERARPDSRNVIVTAEELTRRDQDSEPFVRARVLSAAAGMLRDVPASLVVPASRFLAPVCIAVASAGVWVLVLASPAGVRSTYERIASALPGGSARLDLTVTITPPQYLDDEPRRVVNPERLDVLEGSRLAFSIPGARLTVRFGDTPAADEGRDHVVRSSGYFSVEVEGQAERRLIPVTAAPDRPPSVRIERPGKDLLIAAGDRTIPITAIAADDLGLRSLELRFTKVTGSGEQFEFEEGSLPVKLERQSEREWRAAGAFVLPAMKLEPGDSLVYRAVSADRRPGDAGLASSDTFVVEILGPGQAALEGVEMPPELERYGMSQQMIVVKLERLRAEEPRLEKDALVENLASLAAEQRTVRANFIFLLGGHVEDEFEEAEHSNEIQEGRLEHTSRRDINTAIAHMTRAEQGMTALNTGVALRSARDAVSALQRAFGRSRYLLRSLAVRSRPDLARRLTGDPGSASDWRRASAEKDVPAVAPARALLNDILALGSRLDGTQPTAAEVEALAERLLALDPADATSGKAARSLLEMRSGPPPDRARQIIGSVAAHLLKSIDRDTLRGTRVPARSSRLRTAFEAEIRR